MYKKLKKIHMDSDKSINLFEMKNLIEKPDGLLDNFFYQIFNNF